MLLGRNKDGEKIYSVSQVGDKITELKQLRISMKQYLQSCLDQGEFDKTFQDIKNMGFEIDNLKQLKVSDNLNDNTIING